MEKEITIYVDKKSPTVTTYSYFIYIELSKNRVYKILYSLVCNNIPFLSILLSVIIGSSLGLLISSKPFLGCFLFFIYLFTVLYIPFIWFSIRRRIKKLEELFTLFPHQTIQELMIKYEKDYGILEHIDIVYEKLGMRKYKVSKTMRKEINKFLLFIKYKHRKDDSLINISPFMLPEDDIYWKMIESKRKREDKIKKFNFVFI